MQSWDGGQRKTMDRKCRDDFRAVYPLPNHGMLDLIASHEERVRLRHLAAGKPGVSWDRLLFSAKESVYKTWFPLARRWLGFGSADVVIDAAGGTFTARLLVPGLSRTDQRSACCMDGGCRVRGFW